MIFSLKSFLRNRLYSLSSSDLYGASNPLETIFCTWQALTSNLNSKFQDTAYSGKTTKYLWEVRTSFHNAWSILSEICLHESERTYPVKYSSNETQSKLNVDFCTIKMWKLVVCWSCLNTNEIFLKKKTLLGDYKGATVRYLSSFKVHSDLWACELLKVDAQEITINEQYVFGWFASILLENLVAQLKQ